jgi:hypothetical protein
MSEPVICLGQQPCGFFPKRFLVAKITAARRLQQRIGLDLLDEARQLGDLILLEARRVVDREREPAGAGARQQRGERAGGDARERERAERAHQTGDQPRLQRMVGRAVHARQQARRAAARCRWRRQCNGDGGIGGIVELVGHRSLLRDREWTTLRRVRSISTLIFAWPEVSVATGS